MKNRLCLEDMERYENFLIEEERSDSTIKKYMRDIKNFYNFSLNLTKGYLVT